MWSGDLGLEGVGEGGGGGGGGGNLTGQTFDTSRRENNFRQIPLTVVRRSKKHVTSWQSVQLFYDVSDQQQTVVCFLCHSLATVKDI